MTIAESLKAISLYPINPLTLRNIIDDCELGYDDIATADVRKSASYKRAKAQVYQYLSEAPNISENGVNYAISDVVRESYANTARRLLSEIGEIATEDTFGYIGEDL